MSTDQRTMAAADAAAVASPPSSQTTPASPTEALQHDRIITALWSSWIGDAVAMPAHWYYDRALQSSQYGLISSYLSPLEPHKDSWEYFSQITAVREQLEWPFRIFHNNTELFDKPGTHYHHGMKPGENTLMSRVQEQLIQSIMHTAEKRANTNNSNERANADKCTEFPYDFEEYSQRFIKFITTPGAHPDTYVGGAFQHFFRQLAADPSRDPRGKGYDDPCVAGLVLALPLMLLAARSSYRDETRRAQRNAIIRQHLFLTHASELLVGLAIDVADLIVELLHRHEETDGHGRMKTEQAAAILRKALARMIAANVDSVRDGNASCGLPTRNNRKKEPKTSTFKNDVATAAASTPSSSSASSAVVASSDHPAPPAGSGSGSTAVASIDPVIAKQDPVYLAWRAQELLSSPSKRQFSIDELLAMEDREAFDAMFSVRCYAERALPGAVFLALRSAVNCATAPSDSSASTAAFADTDSPIMRSLLANAQLGGDSCHRAHVLGVLLGCIHGRPAATQEGGLTPPLISEYWKNGLRTGENDKLKTMFEQFAALCMRC